MTSRPDICQAVEDRLLDGERLTCHPDLVEHAGSCLDCFRTLTELRDLPRMAEVMRAGAAEQAHENDPGPAFWKAMPERVAAEVLGPPRRTTAAPARRRWWTPATVTSLGLAAAVVALVVIHRPPVTKSAATATMTAQARTVAPILAAAAETDDNLPVGDLANLSTTELRALNQRLTQEETGAIRTLADPSADLLADEDGEDTALERLSSLNQPQLQRLTHSLGLELQ